MNETVKHSILVILYDYAFRLFLSAISISL